MRLIVAFNPGEFSVQIDEKGHVIEPHTWGVADADFVADMLMDGRMYETDVSAIKEGDTNPAVIMAKKELEERLRLMKPPPPPAKATPAAAPAVEPTAPAEVKE